MEIETLQSLLIRPTGASMAKCEIQVTIHTGAIVCDALCWCLMSHSGYVGPLFCSRREGDVKCLILKCAQLMTETNTEMEQTHLRLALILLV